jgi:endoglucanase Acf2
VPQPIPSKKQARVNAWVWFESDFNIISKRWVSRLKRSFFMTIHPACAAAACVLRGVLFGALWGGLWGAPNTANAQPVKLGPATYFLTPKGSDAAMPAAPLRTEAMQKQAAQTNQWYSTLIFNPKPDPLFVQPLTVKTGPGGFEMALPTQEIVPSERRDVEVRFPHKDPLLFSPAAFEPGTAKLAKAGDWSIDIAMASNTQAADQFTATVAHGSPFVSFQISRGDVRLRLPAAGVVVAAGGAGTAGAAADPRVLALRVKGKTYALFGPTGVRWESVSATEWRGRLPPDKGYWSAAALPDEKPETLALFTRHAYAFIEDTRVAWRFDPATSQVESTFKASTRTVEGPDNGPLLGLYPHHWFNNASVAGQLGPAFDTVRGKIKLLASPEFKTRFAYTGLVPFWPGIKASPRLAELNELMAKDQRDARRMMLQEGKGAYWQGKGLQRNLKLMDVMEQQGNLEGRDALLTMLKKRIEEWFSGASSKGYFHYNKTLGAVASYPDEFFTVEQINDHHFTYGYWIRTVAEIALRDPAWAAKNQWGGLVDLLVADIATAERGRADFPFLRNFDAYEGHAWASGVGGVGAYGAFGNNQESSSESINAWAGLILWAEVNGDTALRDLGLFLYTTEIEAIHHYWFDAHGLVFPPEYKNVEVSQVFGGQYIHNTWWTDEPRQTKGINLLPISTASLYLGRDAKYVQRNLAALKPEMATYAQFGKKPPYPPPADVWQDIFAKYAALAEPAQGLAMWDRWGAVELGDTRSHALHWLLSLNEMGAPDASVSADTTLYSVFRKPDGSKTHLAFNASKAPITVRFSDGLVLNVAPGALARAP